MTTEPSEHKRHSIWFHIFDVVLNIVIILAIVGIIRTFLISPFQVEGSSMVSTLQDNEYIIINKLVYYLKDPQRGEIVVFRPPTDRSKHYVKRILGEPGDTVIIRNGSTYVIPAGQTNEIALDETYLNEQNYGQTYPHPPHKKYTASNAEVRFTVPAGTYFLMGDNRKGSSDSRSFRDEDGNPLPFVDEKDIRGRVWFVAMPITKMHALEHATYN